MPIIKIWERRQRALRFGLGIGIALSIVIIAFYNTTSLQYQMAPGPMNSGHAEIHCDDCHRNINASFRQLVQANVAYALGRRKQPEAFGYRKTDNKDCNDCHRRAKDRHPVYRFMEPKYKKVRTHLKAQHCISCHQEHHGKRVTVTADICKHCHEKLSLKRDPLDVSHKTLIQKKQWNSCLGCHDFHGNYQYQLPKTVDNKFSLTAIDNYFDGGESPYGKRKKYKARKNRND